MNTMMKAALILGLLMANMTGWGKTVGIFKDERSEITDGMLKTLQDAGWQTVIMTNKADWAAEDKLSGLDVIFLPGGWNAYWFANFNARRAMVRFVAGGKGVLAGAFRSGYVRTCNRPLFPQVGAVYNRVNGPYISGFGDSELAKAIDKPFCPGGWDHLVVQPGPLGKVFAVSSDDPVGVYGEVNGGRYLVFGAFIGMDVKTEPMQGTARQALLKMLDWLAAAPRPGDADKARQQVQADLDFLRREKTWDWTLNERGPDRGSGILPEIRNSLAIPLESRQFTLQYMSQYLSGKPLDTCKAAADELGKAMETLDGNFRAYSTDMTARIGKMSMEELTVENPFLNRINLLNRIEAMPGKTEDEKKSIKASLGDEFSSRSVAMFLNGGSIREKFLPEQKLKELTGRADKVLADLRPIVKAAKEEKLAQERKQDMAAVPALIEKCAAPDAAIRREAILELGRIGSSKAVPVLIKALKNSDDKVRINAILGLGWMQSKESVPELIKLAEGSDLLMRRRAVQALGQIGDSRAIKPLLANIGNQDFLVAENAMMSLGWLKAKEAVPELLKLVTGVNPKDARQRALALAAIRALGHIGDSGALPVLEALAKTAGDYPVDRREKRLANIYSSSLSLGLQGHAELAMAEIKAGGRGEIGIRQADFLAARDKFYGLTGRFNALAGRMEILRNSFFSADPAALWPYLWEGGMTGIHQAWGEPGFDPKAYVNMVKSAGEFDFLWIDVLPARTYGAHGVEKPGAELVLFEYGNVPAFHGFWWEETYPDLSVEGPEFEAWLKNKYGAGYRKTLALAKDFNFSSNAWNTWSDRGGSGSDGKNKYTGPLKTELLLCLGEKLLESWRESQEWLHGVRKGCAFTYSISDAQPLKYTAVAPLAGTVIDVNGPENYQSFGRFNSFFMEMHKDGEARPAMSEFYNWYTPSPAHDVRGFAQHLMHGECFYNFHLQHVFKLACYDMWSWEATRWESMSKVFQKARKIREYIDVPASAANVGLVLSDVSSLAFNPLNLYPGGLLMRWEQHQSALWTALNQSQLPTDVIWTETLTPEKLKRYRVLVISDARIITAGQAKAIGDWVNAGGILIAGGNTSLFNNWAEQQKNYAMAELFGVNYGGHAGVADPEKIDTYCWIPGGTTATKAISGLDPENFRWYVHRQVKPVKSLGTYTVTDKASAYLPGVAAGTACEYDLPLGYDQVKPAAAEVLAKFANGDPALTVNKVGKGLCYFWTPIYPGLCHVASGFEMQVNIHDFWPNVRELLAAMVNGGLAYGKQTLPVEISNVSKEIEVTLRQQPEKSRWMVHLLNYDPKLALVKSPAMTVHPPEGRAVKRIFYPDTGTEVKFSTAEIGVTASLRDFEVHDMVVVEWGP